MNILHVGWFDPAGAAGHMRSHLGPDRCKIAVAFNTHVATDADLFIKNTRSLDEVAMWADHIVWHVAVYHATTAKFANSTEPVTVDITDAFKHLAHPDRSSIFFDGSTSLRANFPFYLDKYKDFRHLCSTPDLCEPLHALWTPPLIHPDADQARLTLDPLPTFCIFHAPTDPSVKNTSELVTAASRSSTAVVSTSMMHNPTLLLLMSKCHAVFDHMQGYFGLTSQEASAIGLPVIVNSQPTHLHFSTPPPWIQAHDTDSLTLAFRALRDTKLRLDNARATRAWYRDHFSNDNKLATFLNAISNNA
jgi:hypothetical protein